MVTVGQKVTYVTDYKRERGIVKSISDGGNVFVVYHCADDWINYRNYTAARTRVEDLRSGWEQK